jgi:hypothetical protein
MGLPGVLDKLKSLGAAIKDAPEETVQLGGRIADNIRTEANTPGTEGNAFMHAPLGQYELPSPVRKALSVVAPTPETTINANRDVIQHPSIGNVFKAASVDASIAALPALVSSGARAVPSATRFVARAPLEFPVANPELALAGRVKNIMNDKAAVDRAEAAFTATRNTELPGKIAAVKSEISRIDALGTQPAPNKVVSLVDRLKSDKGWIRIKDKPAEALPGSGLVSPAHTQIRFGAGNFPGEANIGEAPKAGYMEAQIQGGSKPNAVKVAWLGRHGVPGDVSSEKQALSLAFKARGVDTAQFEPLESVRGAAGKVPSSASRSRLFQREARGLGLKAEELSPVKLLRRGWN